MCDDDLKQNQNVSFSCNVTVFYIKTHVYSSQHTGQTVVKKIPHDLMQSINMLKLSCTQNPIL